MPYRLKKGVILFSICGKSFLFPSREADSLPPVILSVSGELLSALNSLEPCQDYSTETANKLRHLISAGFVEEYQE